MKYQLTASAGRVDALGQGRQMDATLAKLRDQLDQMGEAST